MSALIDGVGDLKRQVARHLVGRRGDDRDPDEVFAVRVRSVAGVLEDLLAGEFDAARLVSQVHEGGRGLKLDHQRGVDVLVLGLGRVGGAGVDTEVEGADRGRTLQIVIGDLDAEDDGARGHPAQHDHVIGVEIAGGERDIATLGAHARTVVGDVVGRTGRDQRRAVRQE